MTKTKTKAKQLQDTDLENFTKCDIFTPEYISELMANKLHKNGNLLEPSVGTGNLLKYINTELYTDIDVYELKHEYLEQIQDTNINKYNLDFIKTHITKKYDNIIMNPPYIRIQDLSSEYREYLRSNFNIINVGLVDIYYAFIIKCLELLSDNGIMVAITPNSYLYNKSSHDLRKYLFDNTLVHEIIDFKEQKVFTGTSVYCCITVFTKTPKTQLIYNGEYILYADIVKNYSLFNLNNNQEVITLNNVCKIRNGIATLRDKIFIHDTKLFEEPCWKPITTGPINKYVIYPYENGTIIPELKFKTENPLTYEYLLKNKDELANRDKGNKTYPAWYAYGRSQSIKYANKLCLYIPCFIDPKNIKNNLYTNQNVLHISCLCIEPNNVEDIDKIRKSIINNIDFINNNSSKRSAGWINISSRILYDVPFLD
jgi:adenine-specific DNA-methyltransferase